MPQRRQKLELTWIGKEQRPRLEPRILLEDPEHSHHAAHRVSEDDRFDNILIHGDNLLALKALEQDYTEKVDCVYIDPPFNTGEAMEHYDDGVEHSIWLSLMRDRMELLHRMLKPSGSMFVHIDDNELGYLISILDEVFGRENRISVITFKQGSATGHKAINPGVVTTSNFVLFYTKDKSSWKIKRVYTSRERDKRYNKYIVNKEDHYSKWETATLNQAFGESLGLGHLSTRKLKKAVGNYDEAIDEFVRANAESVIRFARPSYNSVSAAAREVIDISKENPDRVFRLERGKYSDMYIQDGRRFLFYANKLKFIDGEYVAGEPLTSIWDDILSNNLHKEGGVKFRKGKKPEALIKRVLELTTDPGDLVVDSFAGSGTTGAVAHKMGRRWIMVELGDHAFTHIVPRLQRVVDGEDDSGVTKATNWKGGGGFRTYRLAPSLMKEDRWGRWIINEAYNAEQLAEALCKHEGFTYAPSDEHFWQHGYSTESDFLYVTTQTLTADQLRFIAEEVGPDRTLLILCAAWRGEAEEFPNLTLKKIPNAVLHRCEWGRDDYSLNVAELPEAPPEPGANGASPDALPLFQQSVEETA